MLYSKLTDEEVKRILTYCQILVDGNFRFVGDIVSFTGLPESICSRILEQLTKLKSLEFEK